MPHFVDLYRVYEYLKKTDLPWEVIFLEPVIFVHPCHTFVLAPN